MKRKSINEMTRKDFAEIKERKSFYENIGQFRSLVIIPMNYTHDSGYKCMDFIAVDKNDFPICKLSGSSDVLHIDGIGGYGKDLTKRLTSQRFIVPGKGWSIDCLKTSKYLRLFCDGELECGPALSSFEIFGIRKK